MQLKGVRYEVGRVHARATAPAVVDLVASGRLEPGGLQNVNGKLKARNIVWVNKIASNTDDE